MLVGWWRWVDGGVEFVVSRVRARRELPISSIIAEVWFSMLTAAVRKRFSAPIWRCARAKA